MNFNRKPTNDFSQFIKEYYTRVGMRCPKLKAIAGKWTFEDLIPGLSDFDTRLIFADGITIDEWIEMSLSVGCVHTELAKEFPHWARILEHLPGINLTYSEMTDEKFYYPEFQQWSFYHGDETIIGRIKSYLSAKEWNERDELFHLKKFSVYYGRYIRGIDPAINLGKWENKYPLHSRFMHYFTPPVQSAVSIIENKGIAGKFESLRKAKEIFPESDVIDMIFDAVDKHYEIEEYYQEPKLTEIEDKLERYLQNVLGELKKYVTLTNIQGTEEPIELKKKVRSISIDAIEQFFEGSRFCRFMKGRLLFYAESINWFDSSWLIRNELGRIITNFYEKPLRSFGLIRFGEKLSADEVLERIDDVIDAEIRKNIKEFVRIASRPIANGSEKKRAKEVADVFEAVQIMIELLSKEIRKMEPKNG